YFGSSAFRAWQVRRLLAEANTLINEGDYKHASLDAQRVLELSPENADATRVIARSAESAGLRRAIEFWRRVTELSKSAEGELTAWAHCAVRFGEPTARAKHLMPCRPQAKKRQVITLCGVMLSSSGAIWLVREGVARSQTTRSARPKI